MKGVKSEAEAEAIIQNEMAPAANYLMELQAMIGDGPGMSLKKREYARKVAAIDFKENPEKYQSFEDAVKQAEDTLGIMNDAVWNPTRLKPEEWRKNIKDVIKGKMPGGKDEKDNPMAGINDTLNQLEGMQDQLKAQGMDFGKIRKNVEKKAAGGDTAGAQRILDEANRKLKGTGNSQSAAKGFVPDDANVREQEDGSYLVQKGGQWVQPTTLESERIAEWIRSGRMKAHKPSVDIKMVEDDRFSPEKNTMFLPR
jgi:hypothetical protein